jgi:hypothetical protein
VRVRGGVIKGALCEKVVSSAREWRFKMTNSQTTTRASQRPLSLSLSLSLSLTHTHTHTRARARALTC